MDQPGGPSRRRFLAGTGAALGAALVPGWASALAPAGRVPAKLTAAEVSLDRAARSAEVLQQSFGAVGCGGLYREFLPVVLLPYAGVWSYGELLHAALSLREVGVASPLPLEDLLGPGLEAYWNGTATHPGYEGNVRPPLGPGDGKWYDDNCWIGLELLRVHELFGDAGALDRAEAVFALLAAGWDTDPTHAHPGGIFWAEPADKHSRNTCSNAPAAQVALQLFERTGTASYLDWGRKIIDWTRSALRDPVDGLYWDNMGVDGSVDHTKWSYNQGTPIGALTLLWRATKATDPAGAAAALAEAEDLARATLAHHGTAVTGWTTQTAWMNAVCFRNLHLLAQVTTDTALASSIGDAITSYADATWSENRDDEGQFRFPAGYGLTFSLHQAAMVTIFTLAARVHGAPAVTPPKPSRPLFQPTTGTWSAFCIAGANPRGTTTTTSAPASSTTGATGGVGPATPATPVAASPRYAG